jgi:pyridoxamine 5'-phosphate oxidase
MNDTRIDQMRKNYTLGGLHETDVDGDPMVQFGRWFEDAIGKSEIGLAPPTDPSTGPNAEANADANTNAGEDDRTALLSTTVTTSGMPAWLEPNAMTLSTATADGLVSSRTVLLKAIENNAFVFYSNYNSNKGQQITENPRVSLCFYWPHLQRQVLVAGTVARIDLERSEKYFRSRPRASQLGAIASTQSSVIASREVLEERFNELDQQFTEGSDVPLPDDWGGYEVTPVRIEFWQGRTSRLHDRLVYVRDQDDWSIRRLSP